MNDKNNPHDDDSHKIEDSEGYVDHEIKKTILRLRDRIDDRDDQLSAMVASGEISEDKALQVFYRTVNQFLRRIEPVLRSDVPGAEHAYQEAELGELVIYPPPVEFNTPKRFMEDEQIQLQRHFADQKASIVLAEKSSIPMPKARAVTGLKEVIEGNGKTAEWEVGAVEIDGTELATFDRGEQITISNSEQYDYGILAKAVRVADRFLNDAGIGIETGFREVDEGDQDPF